MFQELVLSLTVFKKHMSNLQDTCIHGERDGGILIYDLNVPANEISNKFTEVEHKFIFDTMGWQLDDGAFLLPLSSLNKKMKKK